MLKNQIYLQYLNPAVLWAVHYEQWQIRGVREPEEKGIPIRLFNFFKQLLSYHFIPKGCTTYEIALTMV